jgi:hypothetical protein
MEIDKNISDRQKLPSAVTSSSHIEEIAQELHEIAKQLKHDPIALLHLLRTLEQVHRNIQDDYFQSALPDSRQALYALLRDIEESGGWPYIQRWKLNALFANLPETEQL